MTFFQHSPPNWDYPGVKAPACPIGKRIGFYSLFTCYSLPLWTCWRSLCMQCPKLWDTRLVGSHERNKMALDGGRPPILWMYQVCWKWQKSMFLSFYPPTYYSKRLSIEMMTDISGRVVAYFLSWPIGKGHQVGKTLHVCYMWRLVMCPAAHAASHLVCHITTKAILWWARKHQL